MSEAVGLSEVVGVLREIAESLAVIAEYSSKGERGYEWTPEGLPICPVHGEVMTQREKQGDTWYSHGVIDASGEKVWCRGYPGRLSPGYDVTDARTEDSPAPQARKPAAAPASKPRRVAKRDAQAPVNPSPPPPPEEGEEEGGAGGDAVGMQEFWARFHALKNEGRLPDAESVRQDPVVVAAIKTGDFTDAMKLLSGKMRI